MCLIGLYFDTKYEIYESNRLWKWTQVHPVSTIVTHLGFALKMSNTSLNSFKSFYNFTKFEEDQSIVFKLFEIEILVCQIMDAWPQKFENT